MHIQTYKDLLALCQMTVEQGRGDERILFALWDEEWLKDECSVLEVPQPTAEQIEKVFGDENQYLLDDVANALSEAVTDLQP